MPQPVSLDGLLLAPAEVEVLVGWLQPFLRAQLEAGGVPPNVRPVLRELQQFSAGQRSVLMRKQVAATAKTAEGWRTAAQVGELLGLSAERIRQLARSSPTPIARGRRGDWRIRDQDVAWLRTQTGRRR